ncbi:MULTISPECIES: DNA polymerase IV [unclassified Shewanella]|uniref:DNA polymerase IV n=1 Tax=unclassified Shewanella TaxID=196818 RepID=UPI000C8334E1|nr:MULTISPECIES: DNA polymerase IV [unclassified Shewanella]MDO6618978.1 DNA polymerase IV [Shewanella sp. 6_MG-2023]MDO6640029.1 DNA polymerase IV [Shewanella sp. 5_MG-2023]MDO6775035.1 DNA polymerase IV [Shewanella sp. 3_MG-2023]PMG26924.1 DNA polymerase IV [Shewanella sp. 10N.286.52.C2]PMG50245.1 DNA polymerase IV [Shewanella sp. 10N.286.52.B9]
MRKIIHIDMDCYYAAVEMRDFPQLRGKPIAVGGRSDRRGVISTCSYEARKYGVRSAMSSYQALKLCPDLILVPGRMEVYKAVSLQIREIFHRYTELVEPLSLDEAYLDVTDCDACKGSATLIAEQIRAEIFTVTGLTASAGVAPIKFLAKIASDLNKPNGQYVITPAEIPSFIKSLSLSKIPGVGKVTSAKLAALGLETCEDVQRYPSDKLISGFGKFGRVLIERTQGIDTRQISPNRIRKSVGVETTLAQDIFTIEQCSNVMPQLIQELISRVHRSAKDRQIHKQVVKLKFNDFKQTTIEHRSDEMSLNLFQTLLTQALERANGRGIRLIGVSVGLADNSQPEVVTDDNSEQLDLQF